MVCSAERQVDLLVSPEMKKLLGINADRMPPNMLISHILKSEVDLLWVGGIGTYVKVKPMPT